MARNIFGKCLCGAVEVTVTGELGSVGYCHCSQCRRQTGLYYATTNVAVDDVTIAGEENISRYRASPGAERAFCRTCGSALFWKGDGEKTVSLMAGLFEAPTGLAGGYHIYCADKGDFYEINDGLPKFAASRS
ncbi:GFA family protein [Rhizobium wuzhouense]|uniref:Aldehyde-activating protein n=1 Tax=Rhizobium wuzhouense TaxID=1986026 RepID=A0ABX5NVS5_9HYPH|nr:GFA family protein [Rhizobium wuzhouense]PYB75265.1 aldehyde-activating protein [Rhizobium wuzhouense]